MEVSKTVFPSNYIVPRGQVFFSPQYLLSKQRPERLLGNDVPPYDAIDFIMVVDLQDHVLWTLDTGIVKGWLMCVGVGVLVCGCGSVYVCMYVVVGVFVRA